jgi:hypothetical protein
MKIITVIEGAVPESRSQDFERAYQAVIPLSPGIIISTLTKIENRNVYRIETLWNSQEDLQRSSDVPLIPLAVQLFENVGCHPHVAIYGVDVGTQQRPAAVH